MLNEADELTEMGQDAAAWSWNQNAYITLHENRVTLEAYTQTHAKNGENYLTNLLEGNIGVALTTHENTQKILEESLASSSQQDVEIDAFAKSDEGQSLMHKMMEAQLTSMLDTPIDILGNQTPRECANLPTYHTILTAWVKNIENQYAQQPDFPTYDFSDIWKELNIR